MAAAGRRACSKQFRVVAEGLDGTVAASSTSSGKPPSDTTQIPIIQASTEANSPLTFYSVCPMNVKSVDTDFFFF